MTVTLGLPSYNESHLTRLDPESLDGRLESQKWRMDIHEGVQ